MSSFQNRQRSFQVDLHAFDPKEVVYEKMGEYASLKFNCCFNHDNRPDPVEYMKQCSRFLAQNPANELGMRYNAGDAEAVLELALR